MAHQTWKVARNRGLLKYSVHGTALVATAFLVGCSNLTNVSTMERGIWSEDNESILLVQTELQVPLNLVESAIGTVDNELELFLLIGLLGTFSTGHIEWNQVEPDLSNPTELLRWTGQNDNRGIWYMQPNYWLSSYRKVVAMRLATIPCGEGCTTEMPRACTFDVDGLVRDDLVTPADVLADVLGLKAESTDIELDAIEAIPSPDGSVIAVSYWWWWDDTVLISFFDTESGDWIRTENLTSLTSPNYPVILRSPLESGRVSDEELDDPYWSLFLWRKDSRGVYIIDTLCTETECPPLEAWFIPVDPDSNASPVLEVPARAVATRGGRVSDTGIEVVAVTAAEDSFIQQPSLVQHEGWVAFDDIPAVSVSQIDYLYQP